MLRTSLLATTANAMITGTNIGGWMVLEPWITPSLFYQFLNKKGPDGVGMDSWTLCEALGPVAGNSLMRAHWDTWYTEQMISDLADRGVEMVRLPIGDWTLDPYGPYVGCMDGAKDYIDTMFDWCDKYGIKILLDVHAHKGSQNGFDNSGRAWHLEWSEDGDKFTHWQIGAAEWQGKWDMDKGRYTAFDYLNIKRSVDQCEEMLKRWGSHPAFGAFEPINEPWWSTEAVLLKDFYRQTRALVQKYAPDATFVFHDSFHFDVDYWNDLFDDDDIENVAMDHHFYQAFYNPPVKDVADSCQNYEDEAARAADFKYDIWIGEWALATDVCALWLGGFNDDNTPKQHQCQMVDCPPTYLPDVFTNATVDPTIAINGPFGPGPNGDYQSQNSTIRYGKCTKDSDHFGYDDVKTIAKCALTAFNKHVAGQFLWTAHNELEERWSYLKAYDAGWLNQTISNEP